MTAPRPSLVAVLRWRGALRHRNFRLFFFGQLISLVGTWMQSVAQAWLVLLLTHDPFWLGVVAAVQFSPVMILGLFGGVIADLLPKRRTIVATQAILMVLALILAGLSYAHIVQVWHILVLAIALGMVNAVDMPTRQSFVIEMVGRDDVANAVGLNSAMFNAARILGPAVAGLIVGAFGVTACFFLNGLSFVAVIAGLLAMRERDLLPATRLTRPRGAAEVGANLAEGLRYVRRTPIVLLAVGLVGVVSTAGMNFNVLVPAMANNVLGVGATGLGFLMSAMGLGSLLAALGVAWLGRPRVPVLLVGALALGTLEVVFAAVRSFPLALVAVFGAGVGAIAMTATANSAIQLAVPDALRGRVMSVYTTVFAGSTPIGGLIAGWLASSFGTPVSLAVGGAVSAVGALGATVWVVRSGQFEASLEGSVGRLRGRPAQRAGRREAAAVAEAVREPLLGDGDRQVPAEPVEVAPLRSTTSGRGAAAAPGARDERVASAAPRAR
ncbi:MAG TPA: MFS transporter [Candidatus Limnocylindrales bacterium]